MKLQHKLNIDDTDDIVWVTAPVMIPYTPDCDYACGEPTLTVEEIKEFKEGYMENVDFEHDKKIRTNDTHSWILDEDTLFETVQGVQMYPKGTWMLTSYFTDEDTISEVKESDFTGYSPSIISRGQLGANKAVNSFGNSLIKDITDPVVYSVSLTKKPCLKESKFIIKKIGVDDLTKKTQEEASITCRVLKALGMDEKANELELAALKSEYDEKLEAMKSEYDNKLDAIDQKLDKLVKPLEKALKSEEEGGDEEEEELDEEELDEEELDEEVAAKTKKGKKTAAKSKQKPVHDNGQHAEKSVTDIYTFLGRNPDGTRKKQ